MGRVLEARLRPQLTGCITNYSGAHRRDTLLVTGSEDDAGLATVAGVAEQEYDRPASRPILTVPLVLAGGEWRAYLPEPERPSHGAIKMLWLRSLGGDYADQAELLNALHEKAGQNLHVTSYSVVQDRDTGAYSSDCVWSEGVEALLPEADEVFFFRPDGAGDGEVVAKADWDRVVSAAGGLVEPQGLYPERYRVRSFPSDEQLDGLGKAS